jgi:excisionase family DNA binding protein
MTPGDVLLTTVQAAERLGVRPRRVRGLVDEGRLPVAVRRPRRLLVHAADVEALAAEREANPPRPGRPKGDPRSVTSGRRGAAVRWGHERAAA